MSEAMNRAIPAPPSQAHIMQAVRAALQEDLYNATPPCDNTWDSARDLTARLIPPDQHITAEITAREEAILCGTPYANAVFQAVDSAIQCTWQVADGEPLVRDMPCATVTGPARALLTAERTVLNYLQTLSATATMTHAYVKAVAHTKARIYDTRKTIPGLRHAQKYAVRCGGGHNHRMGLDDAILIKENHLAAAGGMANVLALAQQIALDADAERGHTAQPIIEIEVETITELTSALDHGADLILLDNFTLAATREAVAYVRSQRPSCQLEASGGIDHDTVVAIAETGVDRIALGCLTKHIHAVDLSMRCVNEH